MINEKDEDTLVFFVSKKVTFIKISFPCILLSFPFLKTKEEPSNYQRSTHNKKCVFCIYNLVYSKKNCNFAPWTCAGDVCTSSAEGSRHIKKAFITLCSDYQKSRKFQLYAGLSNGRCPTGYKIIPLVPIMVRILRIYVCEYAYLSWWVAREYILYSAWASRCRSRTMGNARASGSGTMTVGLHAFFVCYSKKNQQEPTCFLLVKHKSSTFAKQN